jgi:hypothetical protein
VNSVVDFPQAENLFIIVLWFICRRHWSINKAKINGLLQSNTIAAARSINQFRIRFFSLRS